ncbi:MAG: DUF898 family protein [Xanthobacteraceae bacterium]
MVSFDASVAAAPPAVPRPGPGVVRFRGDPRAFWRLLVSGAGLLMFTLGIYRFWLTTDVRRYLWANTEVAGESLEYTGTPAELLLGFLIAIAILAPLNVGFFLFTFSAGTIGQITGLLSPVLLLLLGQYAIYRARRYRLTHTIYRGVRFHQSGSAWRYAICAGWWWSLTIITLGLAYPFARASLERFKMRNTFFGNLPGRFEGTGGQLLGRGILLWLLAVVPVVLGIFATLGAVDWDALTSSADDNTASWLELSGLGAAAVLASLTALWLILAVTILYPVFQTLVWRWWASGLRFGEVALVSRLRMAQVFAVYGRFFGYACLFTLVAGMAVVLGAGLLDMLTRSASESIRSEIVMTVAGLGAYVAIALGYSTIYQCTVRLGLWRCVVESLDLSNLVALDRVSAAGEPSSPVGEGLADALNVGGL